MIVVDTSAVIAMMLGEPGRERVADAIACADACSISAASVLEVTMVLARSVRDPKAALDTYLRDARISICAIDSQQAQLAQDGFLTYGKGRHSARLNFGDCFSYAAAKALNAPLLYIGNDFDKTDIKAA